MKKKKPVRHYHDRVSSIYDEIYENSAYWVYNRMISWHYLKKILPKLPNLKVLDLGCGSGYWGMKLLKSRLEPYFVDISQGMINKALEKGKLEKYDFPERFIRAEAESIESLFPKDFFSLIIAYGDILSFTPNPELLLYQLKRTLIPGGYLLANADNLLAGIPYYLKSNDENLLLDFLKKGKTFWLSKEKENRFPIQTFLPGKLKKMIEKAGFQLVHFYSKPIIDIKNYLEDLDERFISNELLKHELKLQKEPELQGVGNHLEFIAQT